MRRRTRLTYSRLSSSDRKHRRYPNSKVIKRSIKLAGNKTSVSLEDGFWSGLQEIAVREGIGTSALIVRITTTAAFITCRQPSAFLFWLISAREQKNKYWRAHRQKWPNM